MPLVFIYIGLFIITFSLFFFKKEWCIRCKKWLKLGHFLSLIILLVDIYLIINFDTSFRTVWVDRFIALIFFITGALTFALYRKTLKTLPKIYFGLLFFYPIIASLTFLIDRIFFVLVASPLIISLITPSIYYSDKNYDIRGMQGLMAPSRFVLIKNGILTETEIGKSDEELIEGNYKNFKLLIGNKDSTVILVDIEGKQTSLTFRK